MIENPAYSWSEKMGCMRDFLFTIICIKAFPYIKKARKCIIRMIG